MIACDGTACKIEWFHYACVNLTRKPNGDTKWFCLDCLQEKNLKKNPKPKSPKKKNSKKPRV